MQGADVLVSNCIVRSACEASRIYPAAGLVTGAQIVDCQFLGVTGTVAGAALNLQGDNTVRGCIFRDCKVPDSTDSQNSMSIVRQIDSRVEDCTFTNNLGLALYATDVSTITNCQFAANTNSYAACWAGDNVVVQDCRFTDNVATKSAGALSAFGATVTNCVFTRNSATLFGGALIARSTQKRPTRVTGCTFSNNTAGCGGALSVGFASSLDSKGFCSAYLLMDRCLLTDNVASAARGSGTYLGGGGIFLAGRAVVAEGNASSGGEITNCRIIGNHANWEGGGLCVRNWAEKGGFENSWPLLICDCLIARNSAGWEGSGLYVIHNGADGPYALDSCTVADNTAAASDKGHGLYYKLAGFSCTNTIFALNTLVTDLPQNYGYCCFDPDQGKSGSGAVAMTPSSGNSAAHSIIADAQLANPDAGDYRLASPRSPCRDAGLLEDWMTAENATDLDGNARVFSNAPDMGCYELSWQLGTLLIYR